MTSLPVSALCACTLWLLLAGPALADGRPRPMPELAAARGCTNCHAIEPDGRRADGLAPIGPAWRDVAIRYRGQRDAEARLVQTVIAGSNPYASHWQGKVSGLAMPPNAVAINAAEARQLVKWILSLAPPAP